MVPTPPPGVAPVYSQVPIPNPAMPPVPPVPALPATSGVPLPPNQEEMELAMAINASIQSALIEGVPDMLPIVPVQPQASISTNSWATSSSTPSTFNGWGPPSPSSKKAHTDVASTSTSLNGWTPPDSTQTQTQSAPSAPPIDNESFYTVPIQYPSIDSSPINISMFTGATSSATTTVNTGSATAVPAVSAGVGDSNNKEEGVGTCVICLDAPVEGACIPCGHMAGCMGCLRKIDEKRGECPICRTKINQVLKLYAV